MAMGNQSDEVSMAVRNWHPGKLILLCAGALGPLVLGMQADLTGLSVFGGIGILVLAAITWHWFTLREQPPSAISKSMPVHRGVVQLSAEIGSAILGATADERSAIRGLTEFITIDNRQLGLEAIALKRSAAFLTITGEFSRARRQASEIMAHIDAQLQAAVGSTTALSTWEERRREYFAVMTELKRTDARGEEKAIAEILTSVEPPFDNVGRLFARACGNDQDPIVAGMGSALFANTLKAVQAIIRA